MTEIRTFDGNAAELAVFCERVWRGRLQGREQFPLWDEAFFEWQLLPDGGGDRDYLVAAYDCGRLVGVLLAEPFPLRLRDRVVQITTGSWLSVEREYRGRGVGLDLVDELMRRQRDRGAAFCLGFSIGGNRSAS